MNGDASGSVASGSMAGDEGEEEQELTIRVSYADSCQPHLIHPGFVNRM